MVKFRSSISAETREMEDKERARRDGYLIWLI